MPVMIIPKDDQYVLNQCTKYLARAGDPPSPGDEAAAAAYRARIAEAWRFPIVDVYRGDPVEDDPYNEVTFVYKWKPDATVSVAVVGTFAHLYEPIPLEPVKYLDADSGYHALTVVVPKGEMHTYKFIVDGQYVLDPHNPQRALAPNGKLWSRFFTESYLQPLILEAWELQLVYRLVEQILPFRTSEGTDFLQRFYFGLDQNAKLSEPTARVYRLDESVGEVNAIDKLLAREEAHRLVDYRDCLREIARILRQRNPYMEPGAMSKEYFDDLYDQMASGTVPGWDYSAYGNPSFFLYILRRHAVVAAFAHPKYSGNVGAAGWAYLSEKYPFDWRPALESPLGTSPHYR